jgi:hypothetical protein
MTFDLGAVSDVLLHSAGWTAIKPGSLAYDGDSMLVSEGKFVLGGSRAVRAVFIDASGATVVVSPESILAYRTSVPK